MALTESKFRDEYPEFKTAGSVLVCAKLGHAKDDTDASVWLTKTDHAVGLRTAHLLALSQFGQNSRLIAKDGTTIYEKQLGKLLAEVASSPGVI